MPNLTTEDVNSVSFSDFPEDVQLCILSFLTPPEIASFACTSKRFLSLCTSDSKLWFTLCDRRWGSKTQIRKWGSGKITYRLLYRTLIEWENLIGFWRRSGQVTFGAASPTLIFFEWGPSFIIGSRVSPSKLGTYHVIKAPFLCMSITPEGETMNFLGSDGKIESSDDFTNAAQARFLEGDAIPVHVSFMGKNHVVVEENLSFTYLNSQEPKTAGFGRSSSSSNMRAEDIGVADEMIGAESGSPGSFPDRFMSEIYQYFANRTSPGWERASRRQRKREKEKQGKRKWVPEHFVKIVNCSPTPSRPLQGLWKGVCDDKNLYFFLVAYDDGGSIACRTIGDPCNALSCYSPVFWTSKTAFLEAPFSPEEEYLYGSRIHLQPINLEVARLQEQLQKEKDLRTALEAGLKISQGPSPVSAMIDEKVKADLEEIALTEADVTNLKQKVEDLSAQVNQQHEMNHSSPHESGLAQKTQNHQAKLKDKQKDVETTSAHIFMTSLQEIRDPILQPLHCQS